MNGIVQAAVANRDLAVIRTEETPVVSFDIITDQSGKLAKFYSELGKEDSAVPIYRATVGLGGARDFNLVTGIDELDGTVPKISGIVIAAQEYNVYFDEDLPGEPPVCTAIDGENGFNRLTEESCRCADCPKNKQTKGTRKECRNKIRLYVLTEGTPVPLAIEIPPASIVSWKKYRKSLFHLGLLEPHEVLTEFTLTQETNSNKIKYSKIKINVVGKLAPDVVEKVEWIQKLFRPDEAIEVTDYRIMEESNA